MEPIANPAATQYLPMFATTPGSTDVFFIVVVIVLTLVVLGAGVLYFTLHSLPERMAHNVNASQLQIVALLTLVALFTHNNAFWIAALLLAAVQIPDFLTPLKTLAAAAERSAPPSQTAAPVVEPNVNEADGDEPSESDLAQTEGKAE